MNKPEPWEIGWFECLANRDDVEFDKKQPKGKQRGVGIGDPLWRVPLVVGPVGVDHNHWAGNHLTCEEADAYKIAAAPVMLWTLKEALLRCSMSNSMRVEIEDAIKLAETGGPE